MHHNKAFKKTKSKATRMTVPKRYKRSACRANNKTSLQVHWCISLALYDTQEMLKEEKFEEIWRNSVSLPLEFVHASHKHLN